MHERGVITLKVNNNDSNITFNEVREDELTINRVSKFLTTQNEQKVEKFEKIIEFIDDNSICKNKLLLTYFNQAIESDCGICSTCMAKNKSVNIKITDQILELLQLNPHSSKEIEDKLSITREETIFALQELLEKDKIGINPYNKYHLQ